MRRSFDIPFECTLSVDVTKKLTTWLDEMTLLALIGLV
jgi:hypothetical protein